MGCDGKTHARFSALNLVVRLMSIRRTLIIALMSILSFFVGRAQASPEADFWKWFQENEATLFEFERDQERTFDRLATEMRKVHPSLTFEFGPKQGNLREFVISADGIRDAFPKVESLYASAPTLPRWTFIKFRPRREPMDLQFGAVSVKVSSVSVLIEPDGHKAGLTVIIPGYTKENHKTYLGFAFLFLDQALGEFDVETRVGFIEVTAPASASSGAHPLPDFAKAFDMFFAKK
jgi:hypothetical protein